ncbi:transglutaminase family protein [uncultured Desulfosarcina sp.]|uniref:transglutaminase-like domain-containing protein n=1 Tax=uncultured Desulfosarcina sp. TaxID=218289 RepID=UPI0029C824AD|nr:transglutaminase family protein [uncultured Desulfosarcina sp.]
MTSVLSDTLQSTQIIDGHHEHVTAFAKTHAGGMASAREQAVSLYYAVRDGIRYDPYTIDLSVEGMRASTTLSVGRGWCVPKAVLLVACCRVLGIPAKLGFADVRNHLSSERLRKLMNTDIFFWHGYASILIQGKWIKATPAFNIELCKRFHLKPLDFDGIADSLYHPFDQLGNAHMEYVRYRGEFSDVPLDRISDTLQRCYGPLLS